MKRSIQEGFTLVEMLVIAPVVILAIGAFITVIVSMVGEVIVVRASNSMAYDIQDALNRIEQDVKLSNGFLAQNDIALDAANDQGYDDNDAAFTNIGLATGPALILRGYATTGNPLSTTSSLVYLTNQPNACASAQISDNTPMTINIVYFIKDNTLWRRTIMPANYADGTSVSCATPWQQPSCTPANPTYTSSFCKTDDVTLVEGVTDNGFNIQYFTSESSTAADTASVAGGSASDRNTALQSITTVGISIEAEHVIAGRTIGRAASLRTSRLDTNASAVASAVVDNNVYIPSNVAANYVSPGQIAVSWNPNGASSYSIDYSTSSSFTSPTTINNITATNQTITGLTEPRYYFRVRAVHTAGTSDWSSSVNAWTTITNGLLAWWPLNNDANDISGNGYHATANNVTGAVGQNGQSNSAYNFNGSNGHVTLSSSSFATNFSSGFTLSIWAYPTSSANWSRFFDIGSGQNSNNIVFARNSTSNNITYTIRNGGTECGVVSIAGAITNNQWGHYVVTQTGGGLATIYRDGSPLGSSTICVPPSATRASSFIGRSNWSTDAYYQGLQDDARIYSRSLTASEVMDLYSAGAK